MLFRSVATVGIDGALNAAILAAQILGVNNKDIFDKTVAYKEGLKQKIIKANEELADKNFEFRVK